MILSGGFTYIGVVAVTPASGSITGGQAVTITGSGFNAATNVKFGGNVVSAFTIVSNTKIATTTPFHRSGVVDVEVVGVATGSNIYTYSTNRGFPTSLPADAFKLPPVPVASPVAQSHAGALSNPSWHSGATSGGSTAAPMELSNQKWLMEVKRTLESVPFMDWGAEQVIGVLDPDQIPQLPTTKIDFTASPRLLGRTSAGAGAGEEIDVLAPLVLDASGLGLFGGPFTAGSIIFSDALGRFAQDNANLFWDDTNDRLGIATAATPLAHLHVTVDGTGMSTLLGIGTGAPLFAFGFGSTLLYHRMRSAGAGNDNILFEIKDPSTHWLGLQGDFKALQGANVGFGTGTAVPTLGLGVAGSIGIGSASPTARLFLPAGTTAASSAPIKFTSGSLLTAPEVGAVEFLTDDYYATITTGTARKGIVLNDGTALTATRVPFATTNGRLTDDADMTFVTDTLTVTKIIASTSLTVSGLTPTRVVFSGAAGLLTDDADLTFATDTLTSTKVLAPTSVSTPSLISTTALTITPLAGQNLNVSLSTTGDFAVNTDQFYVDTSAARVGVGNSAPSVRFHVQNAGESLVNITNSSASSNGTWGITVGSGSQHANGAFVIGVGTGTLAATKAITCVSTGEVTFGNATTTSIKTAAKTMAFTANTAGVNAATTRLYDFAGNDAGSFTITSGAIEEIQVSHTFAPTSGTGIYKTLALQPTINQTGGANGITRGLYINPTITAAADWRALETVVGTVVFGATSGNVGIGVTGPTASLHLRAGTATANTAPLKMNSGTLLTTAEAGAVEFLTDDFYGTITTGAARKAFVLSDGTALTSGRVPFATTNGRLTDDSDMTFATDTLTITKVAVGNKITSYNGVTTSGWGVPAIQKDGRSTAQTAAVASVAAYTVGASDGSFVVDANVNVTTSTTHNFTVAVDYTDETNTAQTLTLPMMQLAGTIITAITNLTGAGPYEGVPAHIRCKASTAITVKTTGTFTSLVYNVEANIRQVA